MILVCIWCYQNLSKSHIWLAKSMTMFWSNFWFAKIFSMINFECQPSSTVVLYGWGTCTFPVRSTVDAYSASWKEGWPPTFGTPRMNRTSVSLLPRHGLTQCPNAGTVLCKSAESSRHLRRRTCDVPTIVAAGGPSTSDCITFFLSGTACLHNYEKEGETPAVRTAQCHAHVRWPPGPSTSASLRTRPGRSK